jgi:hypothetical protein
MEETTKHESHAAEQSARPACSAAREMELVSTANNLAFTLKQLADYHVPQAHPDYELAMSEIADAKRIVTKGKA